jgi:hypothetical protein
MVAMLDCKMNFRGIFCLLFLLLSSLVCAEPKTVTWEDLMPAEDLRALEALAASQEVNHELPAAQQKLPEIYQSHNVVKKLDKQLLKLPGYVVPLSYDKKGMITEFFLVPYFGACIHVPPPPPNQIVLIKTKEPINPDDIWQPFWVEGVLSIESVKNDIAEASYTMAADKITVYEEPQ